MKTENKNKGERKSPFFSRRLKVYLERNEIFEMKAYDYIMALLHFLGAVLAPVIILVRGTDNDHISWAIGLFVCFALCGLDIAVPHFSWGIRSLFAQFTYKNADDIEPGSMYIIGRKISYVLTFWFSSAFCFLAAQ